MTRFMTREEWEVERATEPLRWQVVRWREKRRKTHKLLMVARREVQRLRQSVDREVSNPGGGSVT